GFEVLPVIRVTHTLEPRPGTPTARNRYVMSALLSLEEGLPPEEQRPVAELATLTLREYLEAHADRDDRPGNEVLVFDQFDEALEAIRRPAERAGVDFAEEAARQLVDDLRTVRVQRPGGVTEALGSYVE